MRIVGGRFRGLGLAAVGKGDPGAHLRPTSDRVRESLFNLLINGALGDAVTDAEVLDLFAGTGALGLEALSRGARFVTFVENGRVGARLIAENVAKARAEGETRLLRVDATRLPLAERPATLIFLDPPYGKGMGARALASALAGGWIAPGVVIVWEENAPQDAPDGFVRLDERRYGETVLTFLEYAG
ncbi:16S rRNA (guanine(966)-N(2))-methyltransferase RsmD [Alphaproteobacteria bacterium GH1-50]|uniref:16S rRNA (Guanine(966)-N(2))-methyltransferase RsmD n=1 Tax=Kangsaoukella pontilimi TaxID=2691042 RepID=A0A7C9IIW1_9RHOB|nr:16S rRNA (guanine(966)-N(2))-methyltransferase RsmD [Kangsaoukella pontilimi]MXQ09507.1 16S rRNA (guanine(966)-N(2))-methyltransferase RsmD [Kangsaoukella pontilimi]